MPKTTTNKSSSSSTSSSSNNNNHLINNNMNGVGGGKKKNKNYNHIEIIYNGNQNIYDEVQAMEEDTVPNMNHINLRSTQNTLVTAPVLHSNESSRSNSPIMDDLATSATSTLTPISSPIVNSNATHKFSTLLSSLSRMVKDIDACSPSARSHVWSELFQLVVADSFKEDANNLMITNLPLYSGNDRCTAKFTPYFYSLLHEPTPHFQALQMLNNAFNRAQEKTNNLFKEFSPQTSNEKEPVNHYMVPASMLVSSNLWGFTFSASLQQLALLQHWIPQLESLPASLKKQIWDTCNFLPSFKRLVGNQKLDDFSKVIAQWMENPINTMHLITTLFSSIGFLVDQKVLPNVFSYPTSPTKVFGSDSEVPNQSSNSNNSNSSLRRKKAKHYHQNSFDGEIPSMSPSSSSPTSNYETDSEDECNHVNIEGLRNIKFVNNQPTEEQQVILSSISYKSSKSIDESSEQQPSSSRTNQSNRSNVDLHYNVSSLDALALTAIKFEELPNDHIDSAPSSLVATDYSDTHVIPLNPNVIGLSLSDPPEVPTTSISPPRKRRFSCGDIQTGAMNINNIICS